jgi:hypothetical protein
LNFGKERGFREDRRRSNPSFFRNRCVNRDAGGGIIGGLMPLFWLWSLAQKSKSSLTGIFFARKRCFLIWDYSDWIKDQTSK